MEISIVERFKCLRLDDAEILSDKMIANIVTDMNLLFGIGVLTFHEAWKQFHLGESDLPVRLNGLVEIVPLHYKVKNFRKSEHQWYYDMRYHCSRIYFKTNDQLFFARLKLKDDY